MADTTDDVTEQTPQPAQFQGPADANLTPQQKFLAGTLMIVAILLATWLVIAFWPDKTPDGKSATYRYELMHITLMDPVQPAAGGTNLFTQEKDPTKRLSKIDSAAKAEAVKFAAEQKDKNETSAIKPCGTIQFNTLILILVALAGFLGNMVYVSASLTAFVGAGKFDKDWALWYTVKPFTASGLALFLYLALNSSSNGMNPVNLNGIIATAALTGLFTNIATQKLKEIFTAVFRPSENLPGKMTDPAGKAPTVNLAAMTPVKIDVNAQNAFEIPGQNLDPKNIVVSINGSNIDPAALTVTPTLIKFTYTANDKTLTKFTLLITDAKGVKIAGQDIGV